MNLQEVIDRFQLKLLTAPQDFSQISPTGGYTSDLLSCVIAGARPGNIWVTLQAHLNIIAVGAMTEVSAIIITEGALPDEATLARANQQGVTLLSTALPSYEVAGRLWEFGLQS
jgi:hypothetical protein